MNDDVAVNNEGYAAVVLLMIHMSCSKDGHGGGTVVLVIRGTGHASFTDAEVLFGNLAPNFGVRPFFSTHLRRGHPPPTPFPAVHLQIVTRVIVDEPQRVGLMLWECPGDIPFQDRPRMDFFNCIAM